MSDETTVCDILLPSFGSSMSGATLAEWHVAEGAAVEAGQTIADIETDKAITELEAPQSGIVETILVAAGSEDIDPGAVLARLRCAGAASAAPVPGRRFAASPYARTLARERQIDLDDVAGSGPQGRIVGRDVPTAATDAPGPASPGLEEAGHPAGSYRLEPASRMRRAIAAGLTRSVREIPFYSLEVDIDLDGALGYRRACNEEASDEPGISLNDIVVQACAAALRDEPVVNSAWTDDGIAVFRQANVAIAVATDAGLLAPVVVDAGSLGIREIAAVSRDFVRRAREGKLKSEELKGATFTVSNLGMLGIRAFNSIPGVLQGAILSVGAAEPRPVVRDGSMVIATRATFVLTCDHRVIDGADGAAFLDRLGENLAAF